MASTQSRILIVGGGTAGITVAAILKRRGVAAKDIAIVEPADSHYYQPAFTLVGAGVYTLERTRRSAASLVPSGVTLIRAAAEEFLPDENAVKLSNGDSAGYDFLVVCTGVGLDFDKIEGLTDTLGRNGVCSNYSPDHVRYTWECVQGLKSGAKAVFTQPPLPFKCPGAPQKAAYLTADHLRKRGLLQSCKLDFYVHGPAIFGVPFFARELTKVAARYGIGTHFQHNLVAVDGARKEATFEIVGGDRQGERIAVPFDMLHVSPPQSPPQAIRASKLANEGGWVEVDQSTMRHARYPNVFSLGDVCSAPNSKTAAAVRKQAPVVATNLMKAMSGKDEPDAAYDGYASCPLTTSLNRAIMAEFIYGGKVTPTLPLDPARERWINWWIKVTGLPLMYWHYMLKGFVWFPKHNKDFKGDAA